MIGKEVRGNKLSRARVGRHPEEKYAEIPPSKTVFSGSGLSLRRIVRTRNDVDRRAPRPNRPATSATYETRRSGGLRTSPVSPEGCSKASNITREVCKNDQYLESSRMMTSTYTVLARFVSSRSALSSKHVKQPNGDQGTSAI